MLHHFIVAKCRGVEIHLTCCAAAAAAAAATDVSHTALLKFVAKKRQ